MKEAEIFPEGSMAERPVQSGEMIIVRYYSGMLEWSYRMCTVYRVFEDGSFLDTYGTHYNAAGMPTINKSSYVRAYRYNEQRYAYMQELTREQINQSEHVRLAQELNGIDWRNMSLDTVKQAAELLGMYHDLVN